MGEKILLIDDDPFQSKLLMSQLANLGHDPVDSCTSGQSALDLLKAQNFNVSMIFLDLNMPGMDGVEFIRQLAELEYAGTLVLVSGEDERIRETASRLARFHRLNVIGHLNKPVQPEVLRLLLENGLGKVSATDREVKLYGPAELGRAIARGELVNHYQPKVDMVTGALKGVETLVRWQHPRDGLVFPDQFITVAEEHGLIDDLTRIVLSAALRQSTRWRELGLMVRVAINVSMDNLTQLDFPDFVLSQAMRHGVAARDLILEVTESRLMSNVIVPLDILTRLRLKRISLSIDDFGTGNSSLAQLRDIPFDELKIDRSFVHGASSDNIRRALVMASLAMAKQLGMTSVSEGVEDRADWDFMRQQGCNQAQGYFIAQPMPAEGLRPWLLDWEARCPPLLQP